MPGQRVLEVCVGTGLNLPLLAEQVGPAGCLVGLDISPGMLQRCRRRVVYRRLSAGLLEGEASLLPCADRSFDAVFHFGGFAEFGDKKGAIEEMMRVARPGAKVVICDPGIPTDGRLPLASRLLLKLNAGYARKDYAREPPLDLIPPHVRGLRLSWFRGGAWYMIEFEKP